MLNNIGLPGLLLIAVVVLVLFGRGKISSLMGEVGKGITAFKRGVSDSSADDRDEQRAASAREISAPEHGDATPPGPATAHVKPDARLDPETRKG
ncbi:twin-arginine translocation protein, TatA/E family [Oceaniovalibus guishaninsula JLT2003]|uniref:Sec-independent protein translocase protein TatA n=1 Tax=Oceaniovalibus guishaninsula JLT2003 TaxID=1231392 RepID=K2HCA4_9RHOB|nr:twin-arginine translocase TatA/TatE family subunit [Oceaniovalibus guishaninsula]EKE45088.1 twin-arginine translocation protein, TatA/E family [Oceaniovalibus guishaninsula JLT2003]